MGASGTQFGKKIVQMAKWDAYGAAVWNYGTSTNYSDHKDRCLFVAQSGGNGISDIAASASTTTTLIPDAAVNSNMRCYLTRVTLSMLGSTAWTAGKYVMITDSNAAPLIYIPTNALRGYAQYNLRGHLGQGISIVVTASSYASTTGVITVPATSLINGIYSSNAIVTVIAGTGQGQSALIASNTATTITPVNGASAFPTALDATSVCQIQYWAATAGGASTATLANQSGAAAPLTVDQVANYGLSALIVGGTGAGQVRYANSNTTSVVTVGAAWTTQPDATSLIQLTPTPSNNGILDLCIAQQWAAAGLGKGLQVMTGAGVAAGSNLRVMVEGHYAP